jgi:hypothetical protein
MDFKPFAYSTTQVLFWVDTTEDVHSSIWEEGIGSPKLKDTCNATSLFNISFLPITVKFTGNYMQTKPYAQ